MKSTREDEIHVHCPHCSNKRLFDCGMTAEGIIRIKCPSCKEISIINLHNVTERRRKKRFIAYQRIATKYTY